MSTARPKRTCKECGDSLSTANMARHLRTVHGIDPDSKKQLEKKEALNTLTYADDANNANNADQRDIATDNIVGKSPKKPETVPSDDDADQWNGTWETVKVISTDNIVSKYEVLAENFSDVVVKSPKKQKTMPIDDDDDNEEDVDPSMIISMLSFIKKKCSNQHKQKIAAVKKHWLRKRQLHNELLEEKARHTKRKIQIQNKIDRVDG
jgi:hypothetical protein